MYTAKGQSIRRNRIFALFFLLAPLLALPAETALSLFQSGERLRERYHVTKDVDDALEAVEFFLRVLEENPSYADAQVGLAELYYYLGEYVQAQRYAEEAQRFLRRSQRLSAVYGNILLAQERTDEAEVLFEDLLRQYPQSTEALIGLGDIALSKGAVQRGIDYYEKVLVRDPRHLGALLSLVAVYHFLNSYTEADPYLLLALRYHNRNPEVQYYAARHYYARGNLERARLHAESAMSLRKAFADAVVLLGEIAIAEHEIEEALSLSVLLTGYSPDSTISWYARGRISELTGNFEEALGAYRRGLNIDPDDEVLRLAFEHLIVSQTKVNDPLRVTASHYYLDKATQLRASLQDSQAMLFLRRGLRIHPFSQEMRGMLADIYFLEEDYHNYLSEIKVLRDIGSDDIRLSDAEEVFEGYLAQSVSNRWNIDQFSVARPRIALALFAEEGRASDTQYPFSQELYLWYLHELFLHSEHVEITESPALVADKADALVKANRQQSDYFLVVTPRESARFLEITAVLYVSSSGELVEEYTSTTSGAQRVHQALRRTMRNTTARIPQRGAILQRRATELVFSLGTEDGLAVGDVLDIVKRTALNPASQRFVYSDDDVAGTLEVTALDALLGEGEYTRGALYDQVKVGDWVLRRVDEEEESGASMRSYPVIFDEIRELR